MALVCGKCGNDNLTEASHELQDFYASMLPGKWMKCFACGWRGKPIEKQDKGTAQPIEGEGTMPKFLSEEHRQAWIASVRATKQRKKLAEQEAQGRPTVPMGLPKDLPTVPAIRERTPISVVLDGGGLRQALVQLEDDVTTIRRAIEIMERIQA